jgi:hypothetical protein
LLLVIIGALFWPAKATQTDEHPDPASRPDAEEEALFARGP